MFGLATERVSYDSQVVAEYAQAKSAGNTGLMRFHRHSLIRPDFLPILDRWVATVDAGKLPTGLTEDPEYIAAQLVEYQKAVQRAGASTQASQEAGQTADAYVATTILLAAALFFAGVTASFRYWPARILLLIAAVGTSRLWRRRGWPRYRSSDMRIRTWNGTGSPIVRLPVVSLKVRDKGEVHVG